MRPLVATLSSLLFVLSQVTTTAICSLLIPRLVALLPRLRDTLGIITAFLIDTSKNSS